MPEIKHTHVWKSKQGDQLYLSMHLTQNRLGYDWEYTTVPSMQRAWQGPFPTNRRNIKSPEGVAIDPHKWEPLYIVVSTTTVFELDVSKNRFEESKINKTRGDLCGN